MKRYNYEYNREAGAFCMIENTNGIFVGYSDVEELQKEVEHLREYTDHLVSFSKLPCLPKDLENLREANARFSTENYQLKTEIQGWKNKWECGIEMAAIAENKLADIQKILNT